MSTSALNKSALTLPILHRVIVILHDEDLHSLQELQVSMGIVSRSALIRYAIRRLRRKHSGNRYTICDDVRCEES